MLKSIYPTKFVSILGKNLELDHVNDEEGLQMGTLPHEVTLNLPGASAPGE